ncbi:MAG: ABC transporter substrate-binding protein [Lachnospiraceae bacterium]|nr:ABC transporter substrate-binding protein [Lachnospiraceae bacterium]
MKKARCIIGITLVLTLIFSLCTACGRKKEPDPPVQEAEETDSLIVVGFSQLGAESDWRDANTKSMVNALSEENGYELIFDNAQQKQSNQITAIRTFIQQGVDYIVVAPVTETGWETVLEEARDAGIPVIIVDRKVTDTSADLYTCWVGSDFGLEGEKAVAWLAAYAEAREIPPEMIHIVNIQGTLGSTAQIGRTTALEQGARTHGWELLAEETGEYTQTKGREVMKKMLREYDSINVVYCENDNEAIGAIEAIEEAGKQCGSDILNGEIMVISFDGVKPLAMEYCLQGKISCIAECNPLHGPRVAAIIDTLEKGEMPDKRWYVEESIYTADNTVNTLTVDGTEYPITMVTQEFLFDRAY